MSSPTKPKRPVLRYHGGKWKLAQWIISHLPTHRTYVEPFGGGGSVLLQKPRSYCEVYNDLWDTVVNVFQVLRDPIAAGKLEQLIRLTPFSRTEFESVSEEELRTTSCPIERARQTIFRSFAGFGSAATNPEHLTGFRANTKRAYSTPAHNWKDYPEHIATFVKRLQGVVIENQDYHDVIARHDSPETLFYIDPPYVHATRNMKRGNAAYAFELTDDDHRDLAQMLRSVQGMVVLSGYPSDLYDGLFQDWERKERAAYGDGATARTEVLWLSPSVSNQLKRSKNCLFF